MWYSFQEVARVHLKSVSWTSDETHQHSCVTLFNIQLHKCSYDGELGHCLVSKWRKNGEAQLRAVCKEVIAEVDQPTAGQKGWEEDVHRLYVNTYIYFIKGLEHPDTWVPTGRGGWFLEPIPSGFQGTEVFPENRFRCGKKQTYKAYEREGLSFTIYLGLAYCFPKVRP